MSGFLAIIVLFSIGTGLVGVQGHQHHAGSYQTASSEKKVPEPADDDRKATTDEALAFYTLWLMVFTGVLAVSTVGLWIVTWRGARGQARDMKDSIDAATKSAAVAESALMDVQRAFVFAVTVDLINPSQPSDVSFHFIRAIWRNSGTTPTRRSFNYVSWGVYECLLPDDFDFPDLGQGVPISFPVDPQTSRYGESLPIETNIMRDVGKGRWLLYVWGWCEYNDIFPGTPRHRTEFCYRLDQIERTGERQSIAVLHMHHKHNGSDGECLKPVHT